MTRSSAVIISGAVEGLVDEAAVRRLIAHVGAIPGPIYGKQGKPHLRQHITRYNEAARYSHWIVLTDLDDAMCAPLLRAAWLPAPVSTMCLRVAMRTIETWFLADRQHLARFLSVPVTRIPHDPEAVDDPKTFMVNLARRSRKRAIREDMVPRPSSGRSIGPAYASRLIEFVENTATGWHPDIAARSSDSLQRCLGCLYRLVREANSRTT